MKPHKEYAKELVQSYRLVSLKMSMKDAKACALILCEAMLNLQSIKAKQEQCKNHIEYWYAVKTEIINLK